MLIRPAVGEDGDAIRTLVRTVLEDYGLSYDPEDTDADIQDIERNYAANGGHFTVVTDKDQIVASVGVLRRDPVSCELRKMFVAPDYRRRGLGRRLLLHAVAWARGHGYELMVLQTSTVLAEALSLYTQVGFKPYYSPKIANRCDTAMCLQLASRSPG